jgi:hypothetical protein
MLEPSNRRSLDVLRLRVEVLKERGMYLKAENEASILTQRAHLVEDDEWLRLYHLIQGWYVLAMVSIRWGNMLLPQQV